MATGQDRQIMLDYANEQLSMVTGLLLSDINEMKRRRIENYNIPLDIVEEQFKGVKEGSKMFYCLVERVKKLIDPELKIVVENTRIIEVMKFWDHELEEFLDEYDLMDSFKSGKMIKVTQNKIEIDNTPVPYYYYVEEGTPEEE